MVLNATFNNILAISVMAVGLKIHAGNCYRNLFHRYVFYHSLSHFDLDVIFKIFQILCKNEKEIV
jgi:hypothetical protein